MTNTPSLPGGVEWTAVLVAAHRAAESLSATPALHDPLAEAVMTHLGLARPGEPLRFDDLPADMTGLTTFMGDVVLLRTLHNDQLLASAGLEQIVLLGAGLDGRAYRLSRPGRIFELDRPAMLTLKEDAARAAGLEPTTARTPVAVDLAEEWQPALLAAGFDPTVPTAWVAEGLTLYLTRAQADLLMKRISDLSAPGSRLCLEVVEPVTSHVAEAMDADDGGRRVAAVMRFGPPTPPHDWVAEHGWSPDYETIVDVSKRYGRPITPWFDPAQGGVHLWYFDSVN